MSKLSCENLSFGYTSTKPIIKNFSAKFENGRFYGILGVNGCGKTTLLDLLIGTKKPQSGTVFLDSSPLSVIKKKERAKKITLVPQQHDAGFGYTVEEVVMMGRNPHIPRFSSLAESDWQAVEQALIELDIAELRHRPMTRLSGGQQQRVIVARALAQQVPIMLFDEATANLDIKCAIHIFTLARRRVIEGHTVIAVLHDLNLAAAFCDEILFMQDGNLRFMGDVEEVLTAANIKEIYDVSSKIVFDSGIRIHFQYKFGLPFYHSPTCDSPIFQTSIGPKIQLLDL